MVVDTSNKNQFSYFYDLNLFLKLTRPYPTRQWMLFDGVYILYAYMYCLYIYTICIYCIIRRFTQLLNAMHLLVILCCTLCTLICTHALLEIDSPLWYIMDGATSSIIGHRGSCSFIVYRPVIHWTFITKKVCEDCVGQEVTHLLLRNVWCSCFMFECLMAQS